MSTTMVDTVMADESIGPVVREVERTLLFTDVPCGAMKFKDCGETNNTKEAQEDAVTQGLMKFCGSLERAFCFTDLEDIDEADVERLKALQPEVVETAQPKSAPVVDPADTESCSDDSADANKAKEADVGADKKEEKEIKESTTAAKPTGAPFFAKRSEATKSKSTTILPPANSLQASKKSVKDGKPTNSLQASRAAKKDGKKKRKSWGLFGKKSTKATL